MPDSHKRPPRVADVAAAAGVSTATVSRTFNEPDKVQPLLRERVLAAARELGWQPNAAGSALARRRSMMAGIVIPTLANGIFAAHVGALQERFNAAGITTLLGVTNHDPDQAVRSIEALLARGVEALAIVAEDYDSPVFATILARGVPAIVTHGFRPGLAIPSIGIDNGKAFGQITRHLLELGHQRFGMIAPPSANNARVRARIEGVRSTLAAQGLAIRPEHFYQGPWSVSAARAALRTMLAAPGPMPTALICGNDQIAFGVMAEARAQGLRLPEDLSLTGFDDDPISAHLEPSLTSMRVDNQQMGRLCAELLLRRMQGPEEPEAPAGIELQAELILRHSTAPAPPPRQT